VTTVFAIGETRMGYLRKSKKVITLDRPITVLRDDREKNPWRIQSPDFSMKRKRLDVGDYTIDGYEDYVAIEKKSGLKEFITNLGSKDRKRFVRTLENLAEYEIKCIVIEDTLDKKLYNLFETMPTKLSPTSVYFWINKIIIHYGIPVLFVGRNYNMRNKMLVHLFNHIVEEIEQNDY
jgi:ERCC4-type nuclease